MDEEAQEAMLRLEEERRRVQRERADKIARAVAETSKPCPPGLLDSFRYMVHCRRPLGRLGALAYQT